MTSHNPSVYPKEKKCSCRHHHNKIKKKILNLGSVKLTPFKKGKSSITWNIIKIKHYMLGVLGEEDCFGFYFFFNVCSFSVNF